MKVLTTSAADLSLAAEALKNGGLVAFPTETVYGLGADAFNPRALARVFEAKRRPRFDPLIIHIASIEDLERVALLEALDPAARRRLDALCKNLWPGPLTLVLPKRGEVPGLATSGLPTAAIRFPSHPVARELIRLSTGAVAAPSANLFGRLSPTRAEHVQEQLGDAIDYIIDGGRTDVGVESTVLDLSVEQPRILRPGGCPREAIEPLVEGLIGTVEAPPPEPVTSAAVSPGMMKSHYAPVTPLRLCRRGTIGGQPSPGEGRLYFSGDPAALGTANGKDDRVRVLSPSGDPAEAAANLFDILHELDSLGLSLILAEEAPPAGLGAAINDRLRRAGNKSE